MKLRFGIDLGGTSAKVAAIDSRWRIVREKTVSTSGFPTAEPIAERLAEAVKSLNNGKSPSRVGVGVAGDIDFDRGTIRVSPNLGWAKVPLKRLLEKRLRSKVIVDNDANTAAWGVYKTQMPSSVTNLIVITLGTGVGGGLIINGLLHRGATGSAGELGHMVLDPSGRHCNCGQRGCLETFAGGTHITAEARERLQAGEESSLQTVFDHDPESISPKTIAEAAAKGDELALSLWDRAGRMLGRAIGDLVYVLNPQQVVLSGGVSQAQSLILKPLRETLLQRPFKTPVMSVKISVAKDPAQIGVIGAALL